MDKKTLRNDIILIASLLLVAIISLIFVVASRQSTKIYANVYVQNEAVLSIDLSKKEEKDYTVHGIKGDLTVHTKDGYIAITKSNCPHQDCVKMGYINVSNKPIICAYNQTYVVIEGKAEYDLEI